MKRSTAKLLLILLNIALIILVIIFARSKLALYAIIGVCLLISLILSHFLRCPSCCRGQGRNWLFAEYCPYCGEYLGE